MTKNYEIDNGLTRARGGAYPNFNPTVAAHANPRAVAFDGLLTNKLLTGLPGADFARLLPHLEPVALAPDDNLYFLGDPPDFVYFPESAVISHLHILSDGGTIEADMVGREGLTGLSVVFNSDSPDRWTNVLIGGSALRVRADVMRQEFALCGGVQQAALAYASARLAQTAQRAVCNGLHSVEQRFCSWILMLQDRAGDERLPLTHERIARHLGTRRAGITELATARRARGDISYSRGLIRVTNRRGLEDSACECYALQSRKRASVN
ncbi:MAG TPA: Crp/Fnr family transcriptional regulator [Pyrinomonadaceae bacterium]|jgi:CRP-like cAMP-binding protein|nr:Crp/Fnr family transcriptional regulator [Pyrinomonadaceae bacterium]